MEKEKLTVNSVKNFETEVDIRPFLKILKVRSI